MAMQSSVTLIPIPHPKHFHKPQKSWKRRTKRTSQNRIIQV